MAHTFCPGEPRDIPTFPQDGDTALTCWLAATFGHDSLHAACAGLTFNARDSREFMCDCKCHKLNSEGDDDDATSNG